MKKKEEKKKGVEVGVNAFTMQATSHEKSEEGMSGLAVSNPPAPIMDETAQWEFDMPNAEGFRLCCKGLFLDRISQAKSSSRKDVLF